ncbi:MAG TPA: RNA-binding S4 domain-containing protein [Bacillota bacterium]
MRLDKFLKVSRLIRRRTLAKDVADQGRVAVNGKKAKAGTKVSVGDEIAIQFGQKLVTVQVLSLSEVVKKGDAKTLYKVLKEERVNS